MIRIAAYLAAIYGLMGVVCFAVTHTAFAFLYPAIWLAIALAIVLVIALVAVGAIASVIWLGKAGINLSRSKPA